MTQTTSTAPHKRKPRPSKKKKAEETPVATDAAAPQEEPKGKNTVQVPVQAPAVLRAVVAANPLAEGFCALEPGRNALEVFTSIEDAATELDQDPVNIESAVRLLAGLGVCAFVQGRKGHPNRAVWRVGNIAEVLDGTTEEYSKPEKVSGPINRPLSAAAKISITAEQRAALCKDLGVEHLTRGDLKKWAEELLVSAVSMLAEEETDGESKSE